MKPRKWTAEEKLEIVLQGLKEKKSVAEICREHQISQTLYYRWRDKFLDVFLIVFFIFKNILTIIPSC